ncbi:MAG: Na+/H+ antiporter subunit E [Polyangiaceae bacterium]|nr:Na+/H+ antiporter subunit E [Polyangiaceae bacterium]
MSRVLPHPVTSVMLLITWVTITDPLSPGHWLLGLVVAWALPFATRGLFDQRIRVRSVPRILAYVALVAFDVFASNLRVTWLILSRGGRQSPVLVKVPLTLRDPFAITALASTISYTPGTVSVDVSEDRTHLLVHVFHTDDPASVVAGIKSRYERRLLEIFPC